MKKLKHVLAAAGLVLAGVGLAQAQITVGVTVSATGPAASLGIPERNTVALMPTSIAGQTVKYIVLDDATDPTAAARNVAKLTSEEKVDVIIGSSTVPTTLAAAREAREAKTPILTMVPIRIAPDDLPWAFTTPQQVVVMATAVVQHMRANGVKTMGYIGFNDPYGEDWYNTLKGLADAAGIKVVANERFNRADTSVVGQALKIVSAQPDAVFIGASGTPSVLPQTTLVERGYKGRVYQSHGSANRDVIRVGGKAMERTVLPVGPVLVAEQLPDDNASKKPALAYLKLYEGAHGPQSRSGFGAHAWDAFLLIQNAVPEALKKAKPGTPEFREAMREALERTRDLPATHGVFNMTAQDHFGLDQRGRVLVEIVNGEWKLVK